MTAARWLLLGLALGGAFVALARTRGVGERRLLALGLVVAALVYVGFAIAGSAPVGWLLAEGLGLVAYGGFAWLGLQRAPGWLAAGWALHAVWDGGLHLAGAGAALAPDWYVLACLSFDLLVGAYIAFRYRPQPHDTA